jgi:hypothetical protein
MKNKPTMEQAYEAAEKAEYKGMKKSKAYMEAEKAEYKTEKKPKLSPKQKNIASAAEPKDKIDGADFKALKGKKK